MEVPCGGIVASTPTNVSAEARISLQTCENETLGESGPQLLNHPAKVPDMVELRQVIPSIPHCLRGNK